jgi:hypothetical protein
MVGLRQPHQGTIGYPTVFIYTGELELRVFESAGEIR